MKAAEEEAAFLSRYIDFSRLDKSGLPPVVFKEYKKEKDLMESVEYAKLFPADVIMQHPGFTNIKALLFCAGMNRMESKFPKVDKLPDTHASKWLRCDHPECKRFKEPVAPSKTERNNKNCGLCKNNNRKYCTKTSKLREMGYNYQRDVKDVVAGMDLDAVCAEAFRKMFLGDATYRENITPFVKALYKAARLPPRMEQGDTAIIVNGKRILISEMTEDQWTNDICYKFPEGAREYQILIAHARENGWQTPSQPTIEMKCCPVGRKAKLSKKPIQCITHDGKTYPLSGLTEETLSKYLSYFAQGSIGHNRLMNLAKERGWTMF